ncbi:MAG: DNA recombination protein RmuC [Thermoanaerobaculia bacterium]
MDSSGVLLGALALAAVMAGALWVLRRSRAEEAGRLDRLLSETAAARQASESIDRRFDEMRRAVEERVGGVERRLNEGQTQVSSHLGEMREKMGQVFEATQKVERLATDMTRLEELLRPPKLRGVLGETFLEQALAQILPPRFWKLQYRFRDGVQVDAVVYIAADRCLPVDSKFPLENYRRSREAAEEMDRRRSQRAFHADVRRHVDTIRSKYVRPEEGTTDFAVMYVPAEAVYCEIVGATGEASLVDYAVENRVFPVSPMLLYAYLATVRMGIKGLELQESAQEIQARLADLGRHWDRLEEPFSKLGTHLSNAQKQYEESTKAFERFAGRLSGVAESGQRTLEDEPLSPRLPPPS